MFVCSVLVIKQISQFRFALYNSQPFEWITNYVQIVICCILLCKVGTSCYWYHYIATANLVQLSLQIYLIRLAWDSAIIVTLVMYYVYSDLALVGLVLSLVFIVAADGAVAYMCVWRAHEKLKQKTFEEGLKKVLKIDRF